MTYRDINVEAKPEGSATRLDACSRPSRGSALAGRYFFLKRRRE